MLKIINAGLPAVNVTTTNGSDDNPWYKIIITNAVWHSAVHHRPMVELWIQNIQL